MSTAVAIVGATKVSAALASLLRGTGGDGLFYCFATQ